MSHLEGGLEPNRAPTADEIQRETLYLDAYGIKVSDLTNTMPVDPSKWVSRQEVLGPLIDYMAEEGWAYSGSGFFSAVFVKGGLALKIGLKVTDTGAMYAAWCRQNQGLPGVPTVYSITKFTRCYVLLTRRYDPVDREWLDGDHDNYIREMAEEFEALRGAINIGEPHGADRFDTVETGLLIHRFFKGIVDFDMHKGNIMLDDQGELVITDPVSYGPCSATVGGYSYYTSKSYYTTT